MLLPLLEQLNFRGVIMGSVKLETVSQGRGYHQWDNVSLNNIDVIDVLIRFRTKFDESYLSKELYSHDIFKTNGIPNFVDIISCLYADLEIYIKKANLYKIENFIIKALMLGYTFTDVPELVEKHLELIYERSDIKKIYWNSVKKILFQYNYDYQYWLESTEKVKISSHKKYKSCSMCGKSFERTLVNFGVRSDSKDKLNYRCRKCSVRLAYRCRSKKKR